MFKKPLLIVLSAPSGGGKSTLCDYLLRDFPEVEYSVSVTTRSPRGKEEDGEDYYFVSEEVFAERVRDGAFLEHAVVYGRRYGTLRATVREAMDEGFSVLLDIDVEGARQVRESVSELPSDNPLRRGWVDIFVMPPSVEALRERLEGRGEDSADEIDQRLEAAAAEMDAAGDYRYRIVNEHLEHAYRDLCAILEMEANDGLPGDDL